MPSVEDILVAALFAADRPLTRDELLELFDLADGHTPPDAGRIDAALDKLPERFAGLPIELRKLASGYRIEVPSDYARWVSRLWVERPARYSRALLETLALIAYRQPITRPEIESVRGVAVSTHIVRTLEERGWIRVVGHRDAPGRPALYGTTRIFLDYFGLASLEELPTLAEIRDLSEFEPELPWTDDETAEVGPPTPAEAAPETAGVDQGAAQAGADVVSGPWSGNKPGATAESPRARPQNAAPASGQFRDPNRSAGVSDADGSTGGFGSETGRND
ncbi:MAG: SMC-Scp complex subunit ScpB [Gammaproteobacteria bacterium]|nr:SMC-Scp complex subunit ScpB [Gammaproteobacteria bacterium]